MPMRSFQLSPNDLVVSVTAGTAAAAAAVRAAGAAPQTTECGEIISVVISVVIIDVIIMLGGGADHSPPVPGDAISELADEYKKITRL